MGALPSRESNEDPSTVFFANCGSHVVFHIPMTPHFFPSHESLAFQQLFNARNNQSALYCFDMKDVSSVLPQQAAEAFREAQDEDWGAEADEPDPSLHYYDDEIHEKIRECGGAVEDKDISVGRHFKHSIEDADALYRVLVEEPTAGTLVDTDAEMCEIFESEQQWRAAVANEFARQAKQQQQQEQQQSLKRAPESDAANRSNATTQKASSSPSYSPATPSAPLPPPPRKFLYPLPHAIALRMTTEEEEEMRAEYCRLHKIPYVAPHFHDVKPGSTPPTLDVNALTQLGVPRISSSTCFVACPMPLPLPLVERRRYHFEDDPKYRDGRVHLVEEHGVLYHFAYFPKKRRHRAAAAAAASTTATETDEQNKNVNSTSGEVLKTPIVLDRCLHDVVYSEEPDTSVSNNKHLAAAAAAANSPFGNSSGDPTFSSEPEVAPAKRYGRCARCGARIEQRMDYTQLRRLKSTRVQRREARRAEMLAELQRLREDGTTAAADAAAQREAWAKFAADFEAQKAATTHARHGVKDDDDEGASGSEGEELGSDHDAEVASHTERVEEEGEQEFIINIAPVRIVGMDGLLPSTSRGTAWLRGYEHGDEAAADAYVEQLDTRPPVMRTCRFIEGSVGDKIVNRAALVTMLSYRPMCRQAGLSNALTRPVWSMCVLSNIPYLQMVRETFFRAKAAVAEIDDKDQLLRNWLDVVDRENNFYNFINANLYMMRNFTPPERTVRQHEPPEDTNSATTAGAASSVAGGFGNGSVGTGHGTSGVSSPVIGSPMHRTGNFDGASSSAGATTTTTTTTTQNPTNTNATTVIGTSSSSAHAAPVAGSESISMPCAFRTTSASARAEEAHHHHHHLLRSPHRKESADGDVPCQPTSQKNAEEARVAKQQQQQQQQQSESQDACANLTGASAPPANTAGAGSTDARTSAAAKPATTPSSSTKQTSPTVAAAAGTTTSAAAASAAAAAAGASTELRGQHLKRDLEAATIGRPEGHGPRDAVEEYAEDDDDDNDDDDELSVSGSDRSRHKDQEDVEEEVFTNDAAGRAARRKAEKRKAKKSKKSKSKKAAAAAAEMAEVADSALVQSPLSKAPVTAAVMASEASALKAVQMRTFALQQQQQQQQEDEGVGSAAGTGLHNHRNVNDMDDGGEASGRPDSVVAVPPRATAAAAAASTASASAATARGRAPLTIQTNRSGGEEEEEEGGNNNGDDDDDGDDADLCMEEEERSTRKAASREHNNNNNNKEHKLGGSAAARGAAPASSADSRSNAQGGKDVTTASAGNAFTTSRANTQHSEGQGQQQQQQQQQQRVEVPPRPNFQLFSSRLEPHAPVSLYSLFEYDATAEAAAAGANAEEESPIHVGENTAAEDAESGAAGGVRNTSAEFTHHNTSLPSYVQHDLLKENERRQAEPKSTRRPSHALYECGMLATTRGRSFLFLLREDCVHALLYYLSSAAAPIFIGAYIEPVDTTTVSYGGAVRLQNPAHVHIPLEGNDGEEENRDEVTTGNGRKSEDAEASVDAESALVRPWEQRNSPLMPDSASQRVIIGPVEGMEVMAEYFKSKGLITCFSVSDVERIAPGPSAAHRLRKMILPSPLSPQQQQQLLRKDSCGNNNSNNSLNGTSYVMSEEGELALRQAREAAQHGHTYTYAANEFRDGDLVVYNFDERRWEHYEHVQLRRRFAAKAAAMAARASPLRGNCSSSPVGRSSVGSSSFNSTTALGLMSSVVGYNNNYSTSNNNNNNNNTGGSGAANAGVAPPPLSGTANARGNDDVAVVVDGSLGGASSVADASMSARLLCVGLDELLLSWTKWVVDNRFYEDRSDLGWLNLPDGSPIQLGGRYFLWSFRHNNQRYFYGVIPKFAKGRLRRQKLMERNRKKKKESDTPRGGVRAASASQQQQGSFNKDTKLGERPGNASKSRSPFTSRPTGRPHSTGSNASRGSGGRHLDPSVTRIEGGLLQSLPTAVRNPNQPSATTVAYVQQQQQQLQLQQQQQRQRQQQQLSESRDGADDATTALGAGSAKRLDGLCQGHESAHREAPFAPMNSGDGSEGAATSDNAAASHYHQQQQQGQGYGQSAQQHLNSSGSHHHHHRSQQPQQPTAAHARSGSGSSSPAPAAASSFPAYAPPASSQQQQQTSSPAQTLPPPPQSSWQSPSSQHGSSPVTTTMFVNTQLHPQQSQQQQQQTTVAVGNVSQASPSSGFPSVRVGTNLPRPPLSSSFPGSAAAAAAAATTPGRRAPLIGPPTSQPLLSSASRGTPRTPMVPSTGLLNGAGGDAAPGGPNYYYQYGGNTFIQDGKRHENEYYPPLPSHTPFHPAPAGVPVAGEAKLVPLPHPQTERGGIPAMFRYWGPVGHPASRGATAGRPPFPTSQQQQQQQQASAVPLSSSAPRPVFQPGSAPYMQGGLSSSLNASPTLLASSSSSSPSAAAAVVPVASPAAGATVVSVGGNPVPPTAMNNLTVLVRRRGNAGASATNAAGAATTGMGAAAGPASLSTSVTTMAIGAAPVVLSGNTSGSGNVATAATYNNNNNNNNTNTSFGGSSISHGSNPVASSSSALVTVLGTSGAHGSAGKGAVGNNAMSSTSFPASPVLHTETLMGGSASSGPPRRLSPTSMLPANLINEGSKTKGESVLRIDEDMYVQREAFRWNPYASTKWSAGKHTSDGGGE